MLVVVTLNPFGAEEGTLWLDMAALGHDRHDRFWVRDEVTGEEYHWGQANYVRLEPATGRRAHPEHAADSDRATRALRLPRSDANEMTSGPK